MAQQHINYSSSNDDQGDTLRTSQVKAESNFNELYANKVDKVTGKGLSDTNFTQAEKTKLAGLNDTEQVQADFEQGDNTQKSYIKNKPTKLSDFDNDTNFIEDVQAVGQFVRTASGWEEIEATSDLTENYVPIANATGGLSNSSIYEESGKVITSKVIETTAGKVILSGTEPTIETTNGIKIPIYNGSGNRVAIFDEDGNLLTVDFGTTAGTVAEGDKFLPLVGGVLTGSLDVRNKYSFFGEGKGYVYFDNDRIGCFFEQDSDATTTINYGGYQGGLTRFRSYKIYNGKGEAILELVGSTKNAIFASIVQSTGFKTPSGDGTRFFLDDGTTKDLGDLPTLDGSQIFTGRKTYNSSDAVVGGITINNTRAISSEYADNIGLFIQNNGDGGIQVESNNGNAIRGVASGGNAVNATKTSTGVGLKIEGNDSGATGDAIIHQSFGDNRAFAVDYRGLVKFRSYTVANLPTGLHPVDGLYYATVTDATAMTYGVAPTGGGALKVPVFWNGSNWLMH